MVLELKKELQRVMEGVVVDDDDDDWDLGFTDNVIQTLYALKELKLKQSDRGFIKLKNLEFQEPPQEFRCPISGNLMKDPVVAASGQTFEELSIRKWLKDGNRKCPQTDQLLSHTALIPNHSIKNMIVNWCKVSKGDVPRSSLACGEEFGANSSREHLVELLERLPSSSLSGQMAAVKELRLLTARLPSVRALFGETNGAISRLLSPFLIERCYSDAALCDDVVATVLNISIDDSNKRKIVEDGPLALSLLSVALRSENGETRGYAAAALSALSTVDSNKLVIGESGAVKPLIKVLEEGHPLTLRDAASAVLNLCTLTENRERAISEGAVTAVVDKIIARVLIDEMLEILVRLSSHQRAIEEMEESGVLFCLFSVLREKTSERGKENCVAIVYTMCFSDRRKLVKIKEVENAHETLSRVAKTGTSRAKRKATGLLERLNRFAFISHTA
ncbi:hypothetical protein C2S53_020321 [Perilla frutescens var. hirtella]|uniref:RING-type E3 ubiquitin transferase n=1 Tax=Perilla frutescens var. hirtella TaxID=608512 RepID=A0AAD4IUV7_PERFH|nr:hypothetical protein C2S53_020321 [Perilla frutescens var. hirtella]